jgi:hypothetical protein
LTGILSSLSGKAKAPNTKRTVEFKQHLPVIHFKKVASLKVPQTP